MATSPALIATLVDHLARAGAVTTRRMFGEYCLYLDGTPVALICRDRMYLKPTNAARALAPDLVEESPFPGIRPYLVVPTDGDGPDHRDRLCRLVRATCDALPPPEPRRPRKRGRGV